MKMTFAIVCALAAAYALADDLQKNVVPAAHQVKKAFRAFGKENGSPRVLYVRNSITRHGQDEVSHLRGILHPPGA